MTGSAHDAEDLVQETYLRAWRAFDRFEARSSVRTWLYRIATNACLTSLNSRQRRLLPSGLGPPSSDPYAPAVPAPEDVAWLEPVPDSLVVDERGDPAEVAATRQTVRLALIAAVQICRHANAPPSCSATSSPYRAPNRQRCSMCRPQPSRACCSEPAPGFNRRRWR